MGANLASEFVINFRISNNENHLQKVQNEAVILI